METSTVAKARVVRVEVVTVHGPAHRVVWYAATRDLGSFVAELEDAITPLAVPLAESGIAEPERAAEELLGQVLPSLWARWKLAYRIQRDRVSGAVIRERISPPQAHVDSATASAQKQLDL